MARREQPVVSARAEGFRVKLQVGVNSVILTLESVQKLQQELYRAYVGAVTHDLPDKVGPCVGAKKKKPGGQPGTRKYP